MSKRSLICACIFFFFALLLLHCGTPTPLPSDGGDGDKGTTTQCDWSKCPEGEYCDRDRGCRKTCTSDKECKDTSQICQQSTGRCVDCLRHKDCEDGYECRRYHCFKAVSCRSSKECEGDAVCDTKQQKCVQCLGPEDCDANQLCQDGACVPTPPKCVSDKDCKQYGLVCEQKSAFCVECNGDNDCPVDKHCNLNVRICKEDVCDKGTSRCAKDGEVIEQCSQDGSSWLAPRPCVQGEFCAEGACKAQSCEPGAVKCDGNGVATCAPRGEGFLKPVACPPNQYCKEGQCKLQACKPNEKRCQGDIQETCAENGETWLQKACDSGEFCAEGSCQQQQCQPGQTRCEQNAIQICKANGSGWENQTTCQQDEVCDKGTCIPKTCTPGDVLCAGNTAKTCNADGKSWNDVECKANEYCDKGQCLIQQCTPNERRCGDATSTERCKPNGSGWDTLLCQQDERCDKGQCLKRVCTPNETTCLDTSTVRICDAKGISTTTKACASDEYCDKGVCNKQICTPNKRECAGTSVARVCNASGAGWSVTNCITGQSCQGGYCVTQSCTPGATRCADATHMETCDTAGLNWTNTSCGTNGYCDQNRCRTGVCPEGTSRSCYSGAAATRNKGICRDGTQTCTKGQWTTCQGESTPQTETCDLLDNNCDGQVDEGSICPPMPTLTALSPDGWPQSCGTDITVTGTDFTAQSSLVIGPLLYLTNAKDPRFKLSFQSSTKLTFKLAPGMLKPGTHDVFVQNAPGFTSSVLKFYAQSDQSTAIKLTSVTPATAQKDTRVTVTLSGAPFQRGSIATLNGKPQPTVCTATGASCGSLQVTLDLFGISTGIAHIVVTNPCGQPSEPIAFAVDGPPQPSIQQLQPAFVKVGDTAKITLKGTNFAPGHTLLWQGTSRPSTFVSPTEITTTGAVDFSQATPGTITVQVDNQNGTKSNTLKLTVLPQNQSLSISSLSVTTFEAGKFYPQVLITGQGFTSNTTITFNNQVLTTTFNSATQITIPLLDLTQVTAGTYELFAKEGTTESNRLTVEVLTTASGAPTLDRINPSSIIAGTSNASFYVYGLRFCVPSGTQCAQNPTLIIKNKSQVDFSSKATITATYISSTSGSVRFTLDASSMAPGDYTVAVKHPQGATSNVVALTLTLSAPPKISYTTPNYVVEASTNQLVTVYGSNFRSGITAYLSTLPLPTQYSNASTIRITIDRSKFSPGNYMLLLRNTDGQQSVAHTFAVVSSTQPAITHTSNIKIYKDWKHTPFRVYGTNWSANPTFAIDGTTLTTQTTCRIYSGLGNSYCDLLPLDTTGLSLGTHNLRYQNGATQSPNFPFLVEHAPPPKLTSISPDEVDPEISSTVSINGTDFSRDAVLIVGSQRVATAYSGSNKLTVSYSSLTSLPSGTYEVHVENSDKQTSNKQSLTVLPFMPPLLFYTQPSVATSTSSQVRFYGKYLRPGMTMTVDGTSIANTYRSPTYVEVRLPTTTKPYEIQLTKTNGLKSQKMTLLLREDHLHISQVREYRSQVILPSRTYQLYVLGRGFTAQAVVEIDGKALPTTLQSSTTLRVQWASPANTQTTQYDVVVKQNGTTSNTAKVTVNNTSNEPMITGSNVGFHLQGTGHFPAGQVEITGKNFASGDTIQLNGKSYKTRYVSTSRLLVDEVISFRFFPLGIYFFQIKRGSSLSNQWPLRIFTQSQRGATVYITYLQPTWVRANQQRFLQFNVNNVDKSDVTVYHAVLEGAGLSKAIKVPLTYPWGIQLDTTGWPAGLYELSLENKISGERGTKASFAVLK